MANTNSYGLSKVEVLLKYKECLHNHATSAGAQSLNGCGFFEACGPNRTLRSMARVCVTCHCHRNFHCRVEMALPLLSNETQTASTDSLPQPQVHRQTFTSRASTSAPSPAIRRRVEMALPLLSNETQTASTDSLPQPQVHRQTFTSRASASALSPAVRRQEMNMPQLSNMPFQEYFGPQRMETGSDGQRKILTREQGVRIRVIAESNNWKIFREYSKEEVLCICTKIGITKTYLKAWIFNHRRKRAASQAAAN
ncbi:hypothetical protein DH2020_029760 [Rehmannia glutinosa]|uniref:ZF-HD dimerization-type domain-containing protein n=1 Tax=Rehmannia glutinosa TaxID=99300 RepID=A0ABR0VNL9_REHGL